MIINSVIKGGSGGTLINAITASALPATVVNGQIVVITDTAAGNYLFSYDTPATAAKGDIWIHTVDSGGYSFSIGGITITPGATMQFNGSIWEYRNAFVGINGTWNMFSAQSPFSSLTWEQIVAIANSGEDPSLFFAVGDEKTITLTTNEVVTAVIGDFNHNTITGTSNKAAIALTFKNCLNTTYPMNSSDTNSGGWNNSAMRKTRMANILNTFPAELRADGAIKYVDVMASAGNKSTAITTSSDRLRLHSIVELGLSYSYAASGEGTKYAYYTSGNRVKTVGGVASVYWARSPYTGGYYFCCVNTSGAADASGASYPQGAACCFDI